MHDSVYGCCDRFFLKRVFRFRFAQPNYSAITQRCNLWRNFDDIQDSWASVESIIDYYGDNQDVIAANAAPGHWNDPDMVFINNIHA